METEIGLRVGRDALGILQGLPRSEFVLIQFGAGGQKAPEDVILEHFVHARRQVLIIQDPLRCLGDRQGNTPARDCNTLKSEKVDSNVCNILTQSRKK